MFFFGPKKVKFIEPTIFGLVGITIWKSLKQFPSVLTYSSDAKFGTAFIKSPPGLKKKKKNSKFFFFYSYVFKKPFFGFRVCHLLRAADDVFLTFF